MKHVLSILFVTAIAVSANATTLKYECNMMSTDMSDNYIQGKSSVGEINDAGVATIAFKPYQIPYEEDMFELKIDNAACAVGGSKNCSAVTMSLTPDAAFRVLTETMTKYPQRNTFRTSEGNSTALEVIDADFHPMQAGVVTYESTLVIKDNPKRTKVKAKVVCIFRR